MLPHIGCPSPASYVMLTASFVLSQTTVSLQLRPHLHRHGGRAQHGDVGARRPRPRRLLLLRHVQPLHLCGRRLPHLLRWPLQKHRRVSAKKGHGKSAASCSQTEAHKMSVNAGFDVVQLPYMCKIEVASVGMCPGRNLMHLLPRQRRRAAHLLQRPALQRRLQLLLGGAAGGGGLRPGGHVLLRLGRHRLCKHAV
jgi:hypothetical protein